MCIQHMPFLQVLLCHNICSSAARLGGGRMCTYGKLILRIQAFGVKVELRLIFMQDLPRTKNTLLTREITCLVGGDRGGGRIIAGFHGRRRWYCDGAAIARDAVAPARNARCLAKLKSLTSHQLPRLRAVALSQGIMTRGVSNP